MVETPVKYVFVTGGVVSGLGKGISAASLGTLLKARGVRVSLQKCDPYLNVDPGTMSPFQHGEVFVTEDGAETDLDLGHYERFTDEILTRSPTSPPARSTTRSSRRSAGATSSGATVQVIPHVTDEIKARIRQAAASSNADVVIVEIGGTVGDIESPAVPRGHPAAAQRRRAASNVCFVHVTLVPYLDAAGELKTKTTQHSVNELRRIGIEPDVLVLRSDRPLTDDIRQKIALYGGIGVNAVISAVDAGDIYEVPLNLRGRGLRARSSASASAARRRRRTSTDWRSLVERIARLRGPRADRAGRQVRPAPRRLPVGRRGTQARRHPPRRRARDRLGRRRGADLDEPAAPRPTASWCRAASAGGASRARSRRPAARGSNGVPFLGICLGMQIAVIEFARHVVGMDGANSSEFDPETPYAGHRPAARAARDRGARRHDAARAPTRSTSCEGTRARAAYGDQAVIYERHRHRYEVNPAMRDELEAAGPRGQRPLAQRPPGRGGGAARPPVVLRLAVPPRVQEPAHAPAAALPRVHGRRRRTGPRP